MKTGSSGNSWTVDNHSANIEDKDSLSTESHLRTAKSATNVRVTANSSSSRRKSSGSVIMEESNDRGLAAPNSPKLPHRTVAIVTNKESTPRHGQESQNMPASKVSSGQTMEPFSELVPESCGGDPNREKETTLTPLNLHDWNQGDDMTESMAGLSIRDYFLLRREMGISPSRPFSPSGGAAGRRKGVARPLSSSARAFEDLIRKPSCSIAELKRAFEIQFRYFANRDARTVYKLLSKSIPESNSITLSSRASTKISLADFIPYYDPLMFKDVRKGMVVIFDPTLDTGGLNYSLEASYRIGDHKRLLQTNISSDGLTEGLELSGATWNAGSDGQLLPCQTGDPHGDRKNWLPGWAGVTPLLIPTDECTLTLSVSRKSSIAPSRAASSASASTWVNSRGAGKSDRRASTKKGMHSAAESSFRGIELDVLSNYPMAPPGFIADSVPRSPPRSAPSMFIREPELEEPNELNTLRAPIVYFEAESIHKAIKVINDLVYPQLRAWVASGGSGSSVSHLNIATMHGNMNVSDKFQLNYVMYFIAHYSNADI
jgi:hypothetical protein